MVVPTNYVKMLKSIISLAMKNNRNKSIIILTSSTGQYLIRHEFHFKNKIYTGKCQNINSLFN